VGDKSGEEPVAGAMTAAVGRFVAVSTRGNDHIEPLVDEL